jgi:squalene synthase HpnC
MPRSTESPSHSPPRAWLERDWPRFGAQADKKLPMDFQQASNYCRDLAHSHYENFSIASCLIPKSLRRHLYHVYAYCRWSDDLADESDSPAQAIERLAWWQDELDNCFQGQGNHPVMIALKSTIHTFGLSKQPFDDLLSAFRQDQIVTRYDSDDQLHDYCRRSANPVGRIILQMARVDAPECLEWSDQICTGLQLANFCQDMSRDAIKQRIYLPRSRWEPSQVTEAMILQRQCRPELQLATVRWALDIRERFYDGWQLTDHVPAWLARDIRLFASGGLAILHRIAQRQGDVWSKRIEVSRQDKLRLFLRAVFSKRLPRFQEIALPQNNRGRG